MATFTKLKSIILPATIVVLIFGSASVMGSRLCVVPDNGTGTITMPPMDCEYSSPNDVFRIINSLQTGTTIELTGTLKDFACCDPNCSLCSLPLDPNECEIPGGTLGGHGNCFEATLYLDVSGTGALTGFTRHLGVPVFGEVHTGPRNPGDPVQDFATDLFRFSGEIFGDPDFCVFRITGGTDFGLPSPGQTTLIELPGGDFMVDSFFDITYQIEFEPCPGSALTPYKGGTTIGNIRLETGFQHCQPKPDGTACEPVECQEAGYECQPRCVNFDPFTRHTTILDCECRNPNNPLPCGNSLTGMGLCLARQ